MSISGKQAYDYKYNRKINNIIEKSNHECLEGFYFYLKNSRINELSSQYNYLLTVNRFLDAINKDVHEITLDDYTKYLGKHEQKSSSYRIVLYSALKKLSTYLYAMHLTSDDWMQYLSKPKYCETNATKVKRDNKYYDRQEIKQYQKNIKYGVGSEEAKKKQESWKERDIAIINLFLSTGMRLSALYKLDVDDIDVDKQIVYISEKGGKYRSIQISPALCEDLVNWLRLRQQKLSDKDEVALFISNRRRRLSSQSISNIVEKYGYQVKDIKVSPHALRHTFGTQLYEQTHDMRIVQEALGHNNIHTTELYTNGIADRSKQITNIMSHVIYQ